VEAKRKTLGIIKRVVDWHGRESVILRRHSCVVGVLHIVSITEQARDRRTRQTRARRGLKTRQRERERERERGKRQTETEASGGKKRGKASGNDIINDFSALINVFTDLDSSPRFLSLRPFCFA